MENKEVSQEFLNKLREIYKDVMAIKIESEDSNKSTLDKFYNVMRKHGIKQGEWSENGRTMCNAEWIMFFEVFKSTKMSQFDFFRLLNTPPKDLLAYGLNPHEEK